MPKKAGKKTAEFQAIQANQKEIIKPKKTVTKNNYNYAFYIALSLIVVTVVMQAILYFYYKGRIQNVTEKSTLPFASLDYDSVSKIYYST